MTIECPQCFKRVRICVPVGGDTSAEIYYTHKNGEGKRCIMSRAFVVHFKPGIFYS